MKRSRILMAASAAVLCTTWVGCGESQYANLPEGQRALAEYCDGLGGTVVTEDGKIVNIEFADDANNVTDETLARVAKVSSVKTLYLVSTPKITDAGLSKLRSMRGLETLDVSGSENISDVGLEHLKPIGSLRKFICRGCNQITPAKKIELKEYFKENHGHELLITGP